MIASTLLRAGGVAVLVLIATVGLLLALALVDELIKSRRSSVERARSGLYAARRQLGLYHFQASVRRDARQLRRELLDELTAQEEDDFQRVGDDHGQRRPR